MPVFKITIQGTEYTDRKEAAKAFEDAVLQSCTKADTAIKIGEFQEFPLSVTLHNSFNGGGLTATLNGAYPHYTKLGKSFSHNLQRLEGCLYSIDRKIADVQNDLARLRVDHEDAQKIVAEPFAQETELKVKKERLKTLTDELNHEAAEAKKNAPKREKTCYFERAKLKKEVMKQRSKEKSEKSKKKEKSKPSIDD
ncbi:MAG: hypothetical protein IKP69_09260 [Oscillospiraceae bacterium]|nr:hypothetical protein [Oscillospiraceae bacterium]